MIVITTTDGKRLTYDVSGSISISQDDKWVHISWTESFQDYGDWFMWEGSGFDTLWKDDIVSIVGE